MILPLRDNAPGYELPVVNLSIITICVLVFTAQCLYPGGLSASREAWGEVPVRILAGGVVPGTHFPAWLTLFTSMWMHADFWHIFGNMYALWLFGDNIEWIMGRARYFLFYLLCGIVANVVTTLLGFQSEMAGLGASGAIFGVLGAYLICFPRARITSLMFLWPSLYNIMLYGTWGFTVRNISALWWMGSYIAFELLFSFLLVGAGAWLNLGIYAHASGALVGIGLVYVLRLKDRMPPPEDPTQSGELTVPIIGEEGDMGASYEPVNTLDKELARLQGLHGRGYAPAPPPELQDFRVDELVAAQHYRAALQHCLEMRQLAREDDDHERVLAYGAKIEELRAILDSLPPEKLPVVEHPDRPAQPRPAGPAAAPAAPAEGFDLLNPGQVKRGTRQRKGS